MKKLLSVLLSMVLFGLTFALPEYAADGQATALWERFSGNEKTAITDNSSGVYSAVQSDTTANGMCIKTTEAYAPDQKSIQFKAAPNPEKTEWYTFGIAGANGEIGAFGSGDNRVDLIMHCKGDPWVYTYQDGIGYRAEYGQHNYDGYTDIHTFGLTKRGEHWYFTIDDDVLNQDIDPLLDEILNNNEKVYFIIGAQFDYNFSDIKITVKENIQLWKQLEGTGTTEITDKGNGVYSAKQDDAQKYTRIRTTEAYNPREKAIKFTASANDAVNWYTFGVAGAKGKIGDFGSYNNRVDLNMHTAKGDSWMYINANPRVTDYGSKPYDYTKSHIFGFVQIGNNWYHTIDGKVIDSNKVDSHLCELLNNNEKIYFILGAENQYEFTDIEIVNTNTVWQTSDGSSLAVTLDDNGVYTASNNTCVNTIQKYDLTKYDVSFKFESTGYLSLFISENGKFDYSQMKGSNDISTTDHIEFAASTDGDWTSIPNPNYGENQAGSEAYGGGLIDFNVAHSYGVRKCGEHWYFAVDGKVLNTDTISKRLDDFMTKKSTTEFYISVGTNNSGDGTKYTAEDLKIVEQAKAGDATNNGTVDIVDLVRVKKEAAKTDQSKLFCTAADLNNDAIIDSSDLVELRKILLG